MSWFISANNEHKAKIEQKIKQRLREHPFFQPIFEEYHIPVEDVDNHLKIIFTDLEGKFAAGNGEEIKLDNSLLEQDVLYNNFHYVVHEFFHWIKRRTEALFYFNDDEEIQSFSLAIAWELSNGKGIPEIQEIFLPIIAGHFHDESKAKSMFLKMLENAKDIISSY